MHTLAVILFALGSLVLPPLAGGWLGARASGWPRPLHAALVAAALALTLGVPLAWGLPVPWVALDDQLLIGALFSAGLVGGLRRWRGRPIGGVLLASALAVLLFELVVRRVGALPPPTREVGAVSLVMGWEERDPRCRAFYPERYEGLEPRLADLARVRTPGRPRVVHLGDSMTEGAEAGGLPFTVALSRLEPGVEHLRFGVEAWAPDAYWFALSKWIDRLAPDRVVVHVFPGNDVRPNYAGYLCCGGESVLRIDAEGWPVAACPVPDWRRSNRTPFPGEPPPVALRLAGAVSSVGRALLETYERHRYGGEERPLEPEEANRARFVAAMRGLQRLAKARGVELVVSLVPVRWALGPSRTNDPSEQDRLFASEVISTLGIRLVDVSAAFVALVDPAGDGWPPAALFSSPEALTNPHFSVEGHALYARLLHEAFGPPALRADPGTGSR